MFNYKKRAFTITELVIVIAVVAILAAVLIPTFSNVVKKANQTADIQAVRNANTALANAEVLDGKPASTISDALAVVAQAGYNVESFTPSSNGDILWDQANNRFALVDNEGKVVLQDEGKPIDTSKIVKIGENRTSVDIWMITESVAELESGRYSYYLKSSMSDNIEVTTGVDVGTNDDVNITYATNATQSVDIRTNGGTLTVNAPNSDVHHYGTASEVLITDVKGQSYHEYGKATSITLKSGHVVLESTAEVHTIKVSGGVITNAHNKEFELVADGESVDVTVDGKKVYKVQFFSEENVKLAEQLVVEGEKARDPELKNFGKAGHTFAGWLNGEDKFDFETAVEGDLTLKASWTANTYTITFENSKLEEPTMSVTYGESYTLPKPPARTGYTFAGWTDSQGNKYGLEEAIWNATSDLELTAKWTINTYTVTFNVEGITVPSQTVNHGETATEPTVDSGDYAVVGWYTDATFTTKFDFAQQITKATTLYGKVGKVISTAEGLETELQNEAGAGVICLASGTYEFDHMVTIARDVEIVGVGETKPVLKYTGKEADGLTYGILIQVAGDINVVFDSLQFVNEGVESYLDNLEDIIYVKHKAISLGEQGSFLADEIVFTGVATVRNCTFTDFTSEAIHLYLNGVLLSQNNTFENCTLSIRALANFNNLFEIVEGTGEIIDSGSTFIDSRTPIYEKDLVSLYPDKNILLAGEGHPLLTVYWLDESVEGYPIAYTNMWDDLTVSCDIYTSDSGILSQVSKYITEAITEVWVVNADGEIVKRNGVDRILKPDDNGSWTADAPMNIFVASENGQAYGYKSGVVEFVVSSGNYGTLEQGKAKAGINIIYEVNADGIATNAYLKVGDQWMTRQQIVEGNVLLGGDIQYGSEGNAGYFETNYVVNDEFDLVHTGNVYVQMQRVTEDDTLYGRFKYMTSLLEGKDTIYFLDNSGNIVDYATKNDDGTWKVTINFEGQTRSWTVTINEDGSTTSVEN